MNVCGYLKLALEVREASRCSDKKGPLSDRWGGSLGHVFLIEPRSGSWSGRSGSPLYMALEGQMSGDWNLITILTRWDGGRVLLKIKEALV